MVRQLGLSETGRQGIVLNETVDKDLHIFYFYLSNTGWGVIAEAKWPVLVLDCPGTHSLMGLMTPDLPSATTGAGQGASPPLATSSPIRRDHTLDTLVRLHFEPGSEQALAMLAGGDASGTDVALQPATGDSPPVKVAEARLTVCDVALGLLGGMMMPGNGANSGDMTSSQQLLAFAFDYGASTSGRSDSVVLRIELLAVALSPAGVSPGAYPTSHVMTLSSDWRSVKADVSADPDAASGEFVVNLQAFNPLQMEAARSSGLFMTAGRTFQGTDGATYQIWTVKAQQDRSQATVRRLPWQACY